MQEGSTNSNNNDDDNGGETEEVACEESGITPEGEEGSTRENGKGKLAEVPIRCHLDERYPGMFRVTRAKSKAFQSGGFGVTFSTEISSSQTEEDGNDDGGDCEGKKGEGDDEEDDKDSASNDPKMNDTDAATNKESTKDSSEYLFLEEVLFLFEQGMLECESKDDNNDQALGITTVLTAPSLYGYLETFHIETVAYFAYAHLRQQTFRVMRYTPQRLALLQQVTESTPGNLRRARLQLRRDVQTAPPPCVITSPEHATFAFCVYSPDSSFAKTNPGLPSFLVAVTHYNHGQPGLNYATLQNLLQEAQGIPVKIATVSDSGTVIMFGITDFGVPPMNTAQTIT